jgi:hypothetical protein
MTRETNSKNENDANKSANYSHQDTNSKMKQLDSISYQPSNYNFQTNGICIACKLKDEQLLGCKNENGLLTEDLQKKKYSYKRKK